MARSRCLRPETVAEILGLTLEALADWRKRGIGPQWFKLTDGRSGRVRYDAKDVDAFVARQKRCTGSGEAGSG